MSDEPATLPASDAEALPPGEGQMLLRGGLLRVLAFAAMVVVSVSYTIVLTRHLGVRGFGTYTSVISIATIVSTVSDAGMGNYATREYAALSGSKRRRLMSDVFGLRISASVFGTLLATGFALAIGYRFSLVLGVIVATIAVVPLVVTHTMSLPLVNALRLGVVSGLELARQLIWATLLIALSIGGAGQLLLLTTLLIANLAMVLPTWRVARGLDTVKLALRPREWPPLMSGTAVFSIATAVGTVYMYAAQIVTSIVTTREQTGLFSVSFRVFIVTASIPIIVAGAALPVLSRSARDDHERLAYVVRRLLEISLVAGIGIALTMCAASGFIVELISGAKFKPAGGVLEIQAFAMIATFATAPCSYGLMALSAYRDLLRANGLALLVTIIATIVLADADGARGAAVATICGEATVATLMFTSLVRRRPDFRPGAGLIARLALATGLTSPLVFVTAIPAFPRAVAVAALYFVLILLLRVLPTELLQLLPRRAGIDS